MKYAKTLLTTPFLFVFLFFNAQCDSTIIIGDYVISTNTTLSGSYYVTGEFIVEANAVVTVESYSVNSCGELKVYADKIAIYGDIDGDAAGREGGSGGSSGSQVSSSTGDAAGLTGCSDASSPGHIETEGGYEGAEGEGPGGGGEGKDGRSGSGPKQECMSSSDEAGMIGGGSGASSGGGGSYGGYGEIGGFGGDGSNDYSLSNIPVSNDYAVNAGYGKNGGAPGSSYGTDDQMDIDLGSGGGGAGGGGRSYSLGTSGYSGGTGGGLIMLQAYTDSLIVAGLISVNGSSGGTGGSGGDGGVGQSSNTGCCSDPCNDCGEKTFSCGAGGGGGAGGGSGGGILLLGNGVHYIVGTLESKGGDGGSGGYAGLGTSCSYNAPFGCGGDQTVIAYSGYNGDPGGGGSGGRIKVFASDCFGNIILPNTDLFGGNGISIADEGYLHIENTLPCQGVTPPPVSISEQLDRLHFDFSIYPNPTSNGNINIDFKDSYVNFENTELFIYDVFGKIVHRESLSNNSWINLNLDLGYLSSGVYLIKINSGSYFGEQYFTISK